MPIGVFIDGNVWNFLFERKLECAHRVIATSYSD